MADDEQSSPGVSGSAQRLTDTLVSTVHNRIELFAVELHEEEVWFSTLIVLAAIGAFFGLLAFVSICVTVVWLFPESKRPLVMVAFSVLFLFAAVGAFAWLRKLWRTKPPPLSETLSELKKDLLWLRSRD
jgi:uncharacterized membrane protein YqjE